MSVDLLLCFRGFLGAFAWHLGPVCYEDAGLDGASMVQSSRALALAFSSYQTTLKAALPCPFQPRSLLVGLSHHPIKWPRHQHGVGHTQEHLGQKKARGRGGTRASNPHALRSAGEALVLVIPLPSESRLMGSQKRAFSAVAPLPPAPPPHL